MSDAEQRRLQWRCRRGLLELDLVLNAYLAQHYQRADAAERRAFGRLLEEPDQQLQQWVNGTMEGVDPGLKKIVRKLQKLTVFRH